MYEHMYINCFFISKVITINAMRFNLDMATFKIEVF